MLVLVVSDTHGQFGSLRAARDQAKSVDWLLHGGDLIDDLGEVARLFAMPPDRCRAVAGNCDFPVQEPLELLQEVEGVRIWLTHGHRFDVKRSLSKLAHAGAERGARVVVFGHTHVPVLVENHGVLLFNPGSPTQPRQAGRPGSVGLLHVHQGGVRAEHIWLKSR